MVLYFKPSVKSHSINLKLYLFLGIFDVVVGWDNRSSSFWPRSSDHFDHFGKHQSGIYMPQGPEFICCDYPNPLPSRKG